MKGSRELNWEWELFTNMSSVRIYQVWITQLWWYPKYTIHPHTGAHRALADVHAMKAVLAHPTLDCFSKLQFRSPREQLQSWASQKGLHQRTTSLITSLGKPCVTSPQAKRLDQLGFCYAKLVKLHSEAKGEDDFTKTLKAKGVNSKPLQAKLWKLLGSKA